MRSQKRANQSIPFNVRQNNRLKKMEALISLLEINPRRASVILFTFLLSVSALSGGGVYVMSQIIENEREYARMQIEFAKERYENAESLLRTRTQASMDQIMRSLDALTPLLKEHAEELHKLREEFKKRAEAPKEEVGATDLPIYLQLATVEYRLTDLTRRLELEKLIARNVAYPFPFVPPPGFFLKSLLPKVLYFCVAVAALSLAFLFLSLRKKA